VARSKCPRVYQSLEKSIVNLGKRILHSLLFDSVVRLLWLEYIMRYSFHFYWIFNESTRILNNRKISINNELKVNFHKKVMMDSQNSLPTDSQKAEKSDRLEKSGKPDTRSQRKIETILGVLRAKRFFSHCAP